MASREDIDTEHSDPVEHALKAFAKRANRSSLHHLDMDRFYGFIVLAYEQDKGWNQQRVHDKLTKHVFSEELSEKLSSIYRHGYFTLQKRADPMRVVRGWAES